MDLQKINTTLDTQINEELFVKLVAQLEKDFIMSGITYGFSDLKPNELLVALHEVVEELLSKEYGTLLSLLYRMDIPESAISFNEEITVEHQLVNLMLRRELLKVQMRIQYSS